MPGAILIASFLWFGVQAGAVVVHRLQATPIADVAKQGEQEDRAERGEKAPQAEKAETDKEEADDD